MEARVASVEAEIVSFWCESPDLSRKTQKTPPFFYNFLTKTGHIGILILLSAV
jgi:hypothetical protein